MKRLMNAVRCAAMGLAMASSLAGGTHASTAPITDVAGGADHPMLKRFTGSVLIGYKSNDWDRTLLPMGAELVRHPSEGAQALKDKREVEGKVTKLVYLAPLGKTPLEVHRNHEQALTAAGFKKRFACEQACSKLFYAWSDMGNNPMHAGMTWSANGRIPGLPNTQLYVRNALSADKGQMWVGTLSQGGQDTHVLLYTSSALNATTNTAAIHVEFIESRAMPTGQVTVDAKAMQSGLEAEGKIALYGLYFDTGKAEVKPESKAQLDEMAKLLQAQPSLKAYIVGHTDNQGTLDFNLKLSQQRAQAVVAALVGDYKIDAQRLQPRGVASLAPVASNANDAGRSRNRRVELVLQ